MNFLLHCIISKSRFKGGLLRLGGLTESQVPRLWQWLCRGRTIFFQKGLYNYIKKDGNPRTRLHAVKGKHEAAVERKHCIMNVETSIPITKMVSNDIT